jgi:hypothetical protein
MSSLLSRAIIQRNHVLCLQVEVINEPRVWSVAVQKRIIDSLGEFATELEQHLSKTKRHVANCMHVFSKQRHNNKVDAAKVFRLAEQSPCSLNGSSKWAYVDRCYVWQCFN